MTGMFWAMPISILQMLPRRWRRTILGTGLAGQREARNLQPADPSTDFCGQNGSASICASSPSLKMNSSLWLTWCAPFCIKVATCGVMLALIYSVRGACKWAWMRLHTDKVCARTVRLYYCHSAAKSLTGWTQHRKPLRTWYIRFGKAQVLHQYCAFRCSPERNHFLWNLITHQRVAWKVNSSDLLDLEQCWLLSFSAFLMCL